MHVFYEKKAVQYFSERMSEISSRIASLGDEYVVNSDENELVESLYSQFNLFEFKVDFDSTVTSLTERMIPAENFPRFGFGVERGERYKKNVVVFHIPFSGDRELLRLKPNPCAMHTYEAQIQDGCILVEIVDFYNNPKNIESDFKSATLGMRENYVHLKAQIDRFNKNLRSEIEQQIRQKKAEILNKNKTLVSLGYPVRQQCEHPRTYTVPSPAPQKKITFHTEDSSLKATSIDPTLSEREYLDVLRVILDTGRSFERLPATYKNKSEEDLRDHILLNLQPRVEAGATGETFNGRGKTDILLKHNGSNLFAAECKIWSGKKNYIRAVSQLISYLSWADTKSALIIFVKSKDMTRVLKNIDETTPIHPNFRAMANTGNDSIRHYKMCSINDVDREIRLAVLVFHIPQ